MQVPDANGKTVLHRAAAKGSTKMVKALIDAGSDVCAVAGWCAVPSIDYGQPQSPPSCQLSAHAVKMCASLRLSLRLRLDRDMTPLHVAAMHSQDDEVITLLLQAGPDVNAIDKDGCTALHWAAQKGRSLAVEAMLAAGADIAMKNRRGATTADFAARGDPASGKKYPELAIRLRPPKAGASSATGRTRRATVH